MDAASDAMVRQVFFDGDEGAVETPVYSRDALGAGFTIVGPAVIEQLDSTTIVPPGLLAEVDDWLNVRIHVGEDV